METADHHLMTISHPRQSYDYRIREAICETGDHDPFPAVYHDDDEIEVILLHIVVFKDLEKIARLLIQYGTDVNQRIHPARPRFGSRPVAAMSR